MAIYSAGALGGTGVGHFPNIIRSFIECSMTNIVAVWSACFWFHSWETLMEMGILASSYCSGYSHDHNDYILRRDQRLDLTCTKSQGCQQVSRSFGEWRIRWLRQHHALHCSSVSCALVHRSIVVPQPDYTFQITVHRTDCGSLQCLGCICLGDTLLAAQRSALGLLDESWFRHTAARSCVQLTCCWRLDRVIYQYLSREAGKEMEAKITGSTWRSTLLHMSWSCSTSNWSLLVRLDKFIKIPLDCSLYGHNMCYDWYIFCILECLQCTGRHLSPSSLVSSSLSKLLSKYTCSSISALFRDHVQGPWLSSS